MWPCSCCSAPAQPGGHCAEQAWVLALELGFTELQSHDASEYSRQVTNNAAQHLRAGHRHNVTLSTRINISSRQATQRDCWAGLLWSRLFGLLRGALAGGALPCLECIGALHWRALPRPCALTRVYLLSPGSIMALQPQARTGCMRNAQGCAPAAGGTAARTPTSRWPSRGQARTSAARPCRRCPGRAAAPAAPVTGSASALQQGARGRPPCWLLACDTSQEQGREF